VHETAPRSLGRPQSKVSILAVGDVAVRRKEPDTIFEHVQTLLSSTDVRIANLEAPICGDLPVLPGKVEAGSKGHLRMQPGSERSLLNARFDAVSIANNHMMDFGEDGLCATIDALDEAGIAYAGGGRTVVDAHQPCVIEHGGQRIGLLSYTSVYVPVSFPAGPQKPGLAVIGATTAFEASYNLPYQPGSLPRILTWANPDHRSSMEATVAALRNDVDIVVVAFHWGQTCYGNARSLRVPVELAPCLLCDYQVELGHAAVDAGADLVIGHHPHELQGLELYRGKLICYSLGNFAFEALSEQVRSIESDTIAIRAQRDDDGRWSYTYVPVRIDDQKNPRVVAPRSDDGRRIQRNLELYSRAFGTQLLPSEAEVLISGPQQA